MRILESARDIRYRRQPNGDRFLRVILEEHSPLRVELEAASAEAGTIYRVQRDVGLSAELTLESFDDRVLFWIEHSYSTEVLLTRCAAGEFRALVRLDRASSGHLTIEVAAAELRVGREVAEEFATKFGRQREKEEGSRICVSFWRDSSPHPESSDRFLDAVRWQDVSTNYSATTARKLDRLMVLPYPERAEGRLLLWHGKPGTGKTYALRALAYEWKQWCDIHYVTDPEALLGRAGYLSHLIVHERSDENRWRLLIMEDTGELLSIDARQNVGQALSRLLNTTEGLLGQGLRVLFLITTNEELGKLNPAVIRPGRCFSQVEFAPLTLDESKTWLLARGSEAASDRSSTLAELYSMANGEPRMSPKPSLGFERG